MREIFTSGAIFVLHVVYTFGYTSWADWLLPAFCGHSLERIQYNSKTDAVG